MGGVTIVSAIATHARVAAYADLTEDWNPIHLDPVFAAHTPFGSPIAHGTMTAALIWDAVEAALGQEAMQGLSAEIRFVAPVPVGAKVDALMTEVDSKVLAVTIERADSSLVVEATLTRRRA